MEDDPDEKTPVEQNRQALAEEVMKSDMEGEERDYPTRSDDRFKSKSRDKSKDRSKKTPSPPSEAKPRARVHFSSKPKVIQIDTDGVPSPTKTSPRTSSTELEPEWPLLWGRDGIPTRNLESVLKGVAEYIVSQPL